MRRRYHIASCVCVVTYSWGRWYLLCDGVVFYSFCSSFINPHELFSIAPAASHYNFWNQTNHVQDAVMHSQWNVLETYICSYHRNVSVGLSYFRKTIRDIHFATFVITCQLWDNSTRHWIKIFWFCKKFLNLITYVFVKVALTPTNTPTTSKTTLFPLSAFDVFSHPPHRVHCFWKIRYKLLDNKYYRT